jgi:Glycosyltransferase sugar-binding region containing DXD motif
MTIPARAHFCWIGARLPWAYVFAILSAAERSELPDITLHHTDALEDGAELHALKHAPRVQLSRIDPFACLTEAERTLGVRGELTALYRGLDSPIIRADILRAAILYLQGGVYLDLDTVTTASLLPLLDTPQFVGSEFIVWPHVVRASHSPAVWAHHLTLDLLRKALRRMPRGWKTFRRMEKFYFRGVTNAVMGAEANSRLVKDYLHAMLAVPPERRMQAYALGPDLLQEVVGRYEWDDLTVQEPQVFYPLPPEISEQWFRIDRGVRLNGVLSPDTRVVHWYASVRTKSRVALINPKYVREHRDHQLYSALVWSCIRNLPEGSESCRTRSLSNDEVT